MDKTTQFVVKNRSGGTVVYNLPEDRIRRVFQPGEERKISYEELEKLSFIPGGRELMNRYLQIGNAAVTNNLNLTTEPEYYMSEQDIRELIVNGSMDAFLDCLDFAPVGVLDLIKKLSIAIPCNDIAKRKAIKEKLGFDVNKALEHIATEHEDEESAPAAPTRRVQPEAASSARRSVPNYKVVSTQQ